MMTTMGHFAQHRLFDLHVHLRGTLRPVVARRLAAAKRLKLPAGIIGDDGHYCFDDFDGFLRTYDTAGKVVTHADDLRNLAASYLNSAARDGACYVEFMLSPSHSIANGIPWERQLDAIDLAAATARRATGIETGLIVTVVRHHGPEEATKIAKLAVDSRSSLVRGFGLTGDENQFKIQEFERAFKIARNAGLGLTAHVGEWGDANSVLEAVDCLNLARVGHGLSAAADKHVLGKLRDRGVFFEICQSANQQLGACDGAPPLRSKRWRMPGAVLC